MSKPCAKCQNPLDRRNQSGVCKKCNPLTGASGDAVANKKLPTDGIRVEGNEAVLTKVTDRKVKTLKDLIAVCEIDTDVWAVTRWECGAYQMGSIPRTTRSEPHGKWIRPSFEPVVTQLFTIKAFLTLKTAVISAREEIEALKVLAKQGLPASPYIKSLPPTGKHLLELSVTDPHFGKLAWSEETGDANYDTKVAKRRFLASIDALIQRTAAFPLEKIALVLGGDLFHVDSKDNKTTGGTQVDADSRQQKTFRAVRTLVIQTIERLRQIAPVAVIMVPGNHDRQSVWYLGDSLECWYHQTADVTVDNSPISRKYLRHGEVFLMWTHGDKGKREDYPLLMATERPRDFGETRYREIHTGHLHQTRTLEKHGIRVRILPALCAADAWHSENGMVGNLQGAEAYVWSPTEGLVSHAFYNVPKE